MQGPDRDKLSIFPPGIDGLMVAMMIEVWDGGGVVSASWGGFFFSLTSRCCVIVFFLPCPPRCDANAMRDRSWKV
jgi:hypothetical protein